MLIGLAADVADTFDIVVSGVEYDTTLGYIKITLDFGETLYLTEQDLVTLMNFLRTNKEKQNG